MSSVVHNIYLVEWKEAYTGCDVPWCICIAENTEQARRIHPKGYVYSDKTKRWYYEKGDKYPVRIVQWPSNLKELKVRRLGTASAKYIKPEVIKYAHV